VGDRVAADLFATREAQVDPAAGRDRARHHLAAVRIHDPLSKTTPRSLMRSKREMPTPVPVSMKSVKEAPGSSPEKEK